MATLYLTLTLVDAEKYKHAAAGSEEKGKKSYGFWSWLPWQKRSMPLARGTAYSDAKIAAILRDFLQPDSKMSTRQATASILELMPENEYGCPEVRSFDEICVELAEQIPYDHPSQLKFVMLLQKLGRSSKFMSNYLPKEDVYGPFQHLWEAIGNAEGVSTECVPLQSYPALQCPLDPDEQFPINECINIIAFEAKLFAAGVFGYSPGPSFVQLRYVFESKKMTEAPAWERNAEIMSVAQWIIWHGQTIFKFIIYDDDNEKNDVKRAYAVGDLLEGVTPAIQPHSIERWRHWKTCFEAVETMPDAIKECKMLASRAARLMGTLEENML